LSTIIAAAEEQPIAIGNDIATVQPNRSEKIATTPAER